jgi:uncharacterized protein (DUF433 family)
MRMPVATVVAMIADGMTAQEIISDLPELTEEDVAEALRYSAEAVREHELPIEALCVRFLIDTTSRSRSQRC